MTRLAFIAFCSLVTLSHATGAASTSASGAPGGSAAFSAVPAASQPHRKQAGDLSYATMWRMQKRANAMQPRDAQLITPTLRLAVGGVLERKRIEFLPPQWGVAIVSKSAEIVVPMRRGGYFSVPLIANAQARGEDAIVRFNIEQRKKSFEIAWQLTVPPNGKMVYGDLARAFSELKTAQQEMAWWDIMAIDEKNARFDAIRACFATPDGEILVAGSAAGTRLSAHCSLLPYDPDGVRGNAEIVFAGALDSVTLDRRDNYLN